MIPQDKYKVTDQGPGYIIGEMTEKYTNLNYMVNGTIVTLFDGLDRALDFITTKMPQPKQGNSSVSTGRDGFNSFNTYEEAMTTFRNKPESVVKFDSSELRIKDESEAGSNVDYDVTGDYIDMGRYMEGIPESVGTMHMGNARNRRMRIIISLNQSAGISHEFIQHRGERVLRLVDALEAGGVRSELTGIESSECNHFEVKIKRHDEPLTISDLAVITHPEFLRRAIFRTIEHSRNYRSGYGSAIGFGQAVTPKIIESESNSEITLFIDGNFRENQRIDDRFDQVEKLLVWEMNKPTPEVSSIKVDSQGVYFETNGARAEEEVRREGQEAINAK